MPTTVQASNKHISEITTPTFNSNTKYILSPALQAIHSPLGNITQNFILYTSLTDTTNSHAALKQQCKRKCKHTQSCNYERTDTANITQTSSTCNQLSSQNEESLPQHIALHVTQKQRQLTISQQTLSNKKQCDSCTHIHANINAAFHATFYTYSEINKQYSQSVIKPTKLNALPNTALSNSTRPPNTRLMINQLNENLTGTRAYQHHQYKLTSYKYTEAIETENTISLARKRKFTSRTLQNTNTINNINALQTIYTYLPNPQNVRHVIRCLNHSASNNSNNYQTQTGNRTKQKSWYQQLKYPTQPTPTSNIQTQNVNNNKNLWQLPPYPM
eukprot:gene13054-8900_t